MNRIKSLDGIRALSIIIVLIGHAGHTMSTAIFGSVFFRLVANSGLGVRIFFVISGYLITTLLLKERDKMGTIDIKDFYLRRIFRIFPVFYLYIIVVIMLKLFFVNDIFTDYSLPAFASIYLWNYQSLLHAAIPNENGYWFFGHFWTLSMEEQFYLLWPLLFIMLKPVSLKKVVIGIIVMMPFIRIATYFLMPNSRGQIGMMLQTGGDSILFGCLGALIENGGGFKEKWMKFIENNYIIIASTIFLFILSPLLSIHFKGSYDLLFGIGLNNVFIMILIFWCIYIPSKFANFLNAKPLMHIGVLSYSLYIWQQLFLTDIYTSWVNRFPQNLLLVFVTATVSYYAIEKPILGLKKRVKKV